MKPIYSLFAVLALALSACGTTPAPELGTGVDEIGAYTIVAQSGDETLSAQGTSQKLPTRVLEVREYSNSRYRTVFRVTFPSYTKDGLLEASVGVGTGGSMSNFNNRKLHGSDPRTYSVASELAALYVRRGTKVCGLADGRWGAEDDVGEHGYYEYVNFESRACYRH